MSLNYNTHTHCRYSRDDTEDAVYSTEHRLSLQQSCYRVCLQYRTPTIATVELLPRMFAVQSIDYRYSRVAPQMFTVQSIDYRYSRYDIEDDVYSTEHQLSLQQSCYRVCLQYRASTITTVELLPRMFTVQSIDYPYSRDGTEDGVYSTEHRLSLQQSCYRICLQYRASTIATVELLPRRFTVQLEHPIIATVETVPKMTFTVQSINYYYSRVATAYVYSTEHRLSLQWSCYRVGLQYTASTVELLPKMPFTVPSTIATVELLPQMFTVQSIGYRYSKNDTKDDVYSTEYQLSLQQIDYHYSRVATADVYSTEY